MRVFGTVKDAATEMPLPGAKIILYIREKELAVLYSDSKGKLEHKEAAQYIGEVPLSGLRRVSPERTTSYTLIAINEEGNRIKEEVTVEVIVPSEHSISNIQLDPRSPASLLLNQEVKVTFDYATTETEGVLIFVRPFTDGSLTPNYAASGSPLYSTGRGKGEGDFTLRSGEVTVDQLRFQILSRDQSRVLHESFISVNYRFRTLK